MKKYLFVSVLSLLASMSFSQSLQILTMEDVNVSGTEQFYSGDISDNFNTVIEHFKIRNNTDNPIDVIVKKNYLDVVNGTYNDFCWAGTCLTDQIMQSGSMTVAADSEQEDFDIHYHCQGMEGTTRIMYVAFDEANPDDSVAFTVNYTVDGAAVENQFGQMLVSDVFPNPANDIAKIRYNLPLNEVLKVQIFNVLGNALMSFVVSGSGNIVIPTNELGAGTYFCTFTLNGEILETQKLIVR
jgi:hypothetical protein